MCLQEQDVKHVNRYGRCIVNHEPVCHEGDDGIPQSYMLTISKMKFAFGSKNITNVN